MLSVRRVPSRPAIVLCIGVMLCSGAIGLELTSSPSVTRRPTFATATQQAISLPAPPDGFAIPKPRALGDATRETRWAPVIRATVARREPNLASAIVNSVSIRTPEGTANLVVATGEVTRNGATWVRASLPTTTPRDAQGWIPRSSLGGWTFVNTRVIVNRLRLTLTLLRAGRAIFRAPVGIGAATNPTPPGTYYIRDRLTSFASPFYGPVAFGISARAPHLTDWPGGGYIGIHGTDEPGLIPGRISHGCIRLTNYAILRLSRLMPVGTPVNIQ